MRIHCFFFLNVSAGKVKASFPKDRLPCVETFPQSVPVFVFILPQSLQRRGNQESCGSVQLTQFTLPGSRDLEMMSGSEISDLSSTPLSRLDLPVFDPPLAGSASVDVGHGFNNNKKKP